MSTRAKEIEKEAEVMSEEIMVQKVSKLLKNTNPKIQKIHTISSRNLKKIS